MSRVHVLTLGLAITSLTVAGCDDERTECELGETQACTCPDGTGGTQICTAAGEFSACMCATPMIDAGPGMDAGRDAGRDAGGEDGGPDEDSGIVIMVDGGTETDGGAENDSGTPGTDSGTPGTDSGTPGTDSGTPGTDSGTPGTDSGTPATDAGTDAGPVTTCDVTGFAPTTFQTVADATDEFLIHRMTAASGDFLQLELYFAAGAMDTPHTATFTGENYATCDTCLVLVAGGAIYLAESGTAEFTSLSRTALAGTLTDVSLIEVTLDASNNSTPVAGGNVWCIPSLAFSGNAVGCGNGICEAGETAASCAGDCTGGCGDGVCTALTGGTETPGNCQADCACELFGTDTCAGTNRCSEPFDRANVVGAISPFDPVGVCGPSGGTGTDGAACTNSFDCAPGYACGGTAGCVGLLCDPLHHVTGAGSCGGGAGCYPLGDADGNYFVVGQCGATCDPFTTTGCSSGEWCSPDFYSRDVGFCETIGTVTAGSACDGVTTLCEAGHICNGGACLPVCEAADPDSCGAGNACVAYRSQNVDPYANEFVYFAIGRCAPSCGFDEGTPACTAGVCTAGEFVGGTDRDICQDIPNRSHDDVCTAAELGGYCNGLGLCLERADASIRCTDLCRESAGAFDGGAHPDCPSGTVCLGEPGDEIAACGTAS